MRAQQEGGGEPPTEGDASMSRNHQEVRQKAINPRAGGGQSTLLAQEEMNSHLVVNQGRAQDVYDI